MEFGVGLRGEGTDKEGAGGTFWICLSISRERPIPTLWSFSNSANLWINQEGDGGMYEPVDDVGRIGFKRRVGEAVSVEGSTKS